jgi:hypothetical protein
MILLPVGLLLPAGRPSPPPRPRSAAGAAVSMGPGAGAAYHQRTGSATTETTAGVRGAGLRARGSGPAAGQRGVAGRRVPPSTPTALFSLVA